MVCGERTPRRDGFTIVELLLVVSVLTTALLVLSLSMTSSMALKDTNRETALAADGAREVIERLQGHEDFSQVFALYNADPGDDPPGISAPGSTFRVWGLDPQLNDPDGMVGEIRFPVEEGGLALREDLEDPSLGMPRDLNGDGDIDSLDHSLDYRLLPVQVQVRWTGRNGPRGLTVETFLADLTPERE